MALIHDDVFDAAITKITTSVDTVQVRAAGSSVLVDTNSSISWTGPANGSSGGRKITFDGISGVSVSSTGAANKIAMVDSATVLAVASITGSDVSITSADQVNIGSFKITFGDP